MRIAVLIVTWESDRHVEAAIDSVIEQVRDDDQIIVWDNASSQPSRQAIQAIAARRPTVQFHYSTVNLGFAGGNNAAAALCPDADALLTLNPDAVLQTGALEEMRTVLNGSEDIGAVGLIQLSENAQHIDGLGDVYHMTGLVWRHGYGKDVSTWRRHATADTRRATDIFSPCAAVALYRRTAFDAAGGFDTDYFCYCEDSDLGFRLQLLGWRCVRANRAQAYHIGSTSLGKNSDFSVYHGQRNLVWTYAKNMPAPLLVLLLPMHMLANLAIFAVYCWRGRPAVILKAKADACWGLGRMLKKRRHIQTGRMVGSAQIWRLLSKAIVR